MSLKKVLKVNLGTVAIFFFILILIAFFNHYSYRIQSKKNDNEVKNYVKNLREVVKHGNIVLYSVQVYDGKIQLQENQKAIKVVVKVEPKELVFDVDDVELHSTEGKFLEYGEWLDCLDEYKQEFKCDDEHNPAYYVVLFKVPKEFTKGELWYSDYKFGTVSI